MKVLWLTNIPSPYRVDFFNELGKKCELTVLFEKGYSSERDDAWKNYKFENFEGIILGGISVGVAETLGFSVLKHLKKNKYDHIVVTNYFDFTGMLAVLWMRLKGMRYSVEGDGAFVGTGKGLKEKLKKFVISKALYCFSTCEEHDKYYLAYGAKESRIIRYPFSSVKAEELVEQPLSISEKSEIKSKFGISEKKVILAVGQFIPRKGFDTLLKAAKQIPNDSAVYIVGGEPTQEYIGLKETLDLSNVHFVGFKNKIELLEYYKAADLFVHPTREDIWGLVINEAMACGLPVVTTDRCNAGLEMISDERCVISPESPEELSNAICRILNDSNYANMLAAENLAAASKFTVEEMAKQHIEILNKKI